MEAMIIVGLCLGSFLKGQDHNYNEMSLRKFIDYVPDVANFISGRRISMNGEEKSLLRDQSKLLFTMWNIKEKTWNGLREDQGLFVHPQYY